MNIEGQLINYGILGLWLAYTLYKENSVHSALIDALHSIKEEIVLCHSRK